MKPVTSRPKGGKPKPWMRWKKDKDDRFALLGGTDPKSLRRGPTRKQWLIVATAVGVLALLLTAFVGLEQWQRALDAEHALKVAEGQVESQDATINGLSGRVLDLNVEIDSTAELLSKAQDQASLSDTQLSRLSAALGELSQARELMRAAVENIKLMTEALVDEEFKKASAYADEASSQLEAAFVHEARAAEALN